MDGRRIIVENNQTETKYSSASDEEFVKATGNADPLQAASDIINNPEMEEAEKVFLAFMTTHLKKMDNHLLFDGDNCPSLEVLNRSLSNHAHVMLALTGLYEQNRWDKTAAVEEFDTWYAEKFIEVRTEVNKDDVARSKWYTKDEIDMMVKTKYRKEYKALKAAINLAESKRSLLQRLVDGWNSYQFTLTQLSKNSIAEYDSGKNIRYEE